MATRRLERPRDPAQLAKLIVDIATGQVEVRKIWRPLIVARLVAKEAAQHAQKI